MTQTKLNSTQRDELIGSFVDIQVDSMDMKTLVQIASDNLTDYYEKCSDVELKEEVDNYDEELYEEAGKISRVIDFKTLLNQLQED